jgi:hypothetical protein
VIVNRYSVYAEALDMLQNVARSKLEENPVGFSFQEVRDFRTVKVSIGLRSGTTQYIRERADQSSLVVVPSTADLSNYQSIPGLVFRSSNLFTGITSQTRSRLEQFKQDGVMVRTVYLDSYQHGDLGLETITNFLLPSHPEFLFVLLG